MRRLHLVELEDLQWFPGILRKGMMDYLRFFFELTGAYKPAIPLLKRLLIHSNEPQILDLCSGGGGPIIQLQKELGVGVRLSDKFPDVKTFKKIHSENPQINYIDKSVDALNVDSELTGVRTLFTSFHHFKPEEAKKIIKNAEIKKHPIAIFEGAERSLSGAILAIAFIPIMAFIFCPFMKPFRFSRIFFTYIIPLIPLSTIWDGVVSFLRLYSPHEMLEMTSSSTPGYKWEAGTLKNLLFFRMVYLVGYPK